MNISVIARLVIFVLPGLLTACGGGGGAPAGGGGTPLVTLGAVTPLFPVHGENWNDYVEGDNATATDSVCQTSGAPCVHGGERRVMEATGQSSCTGLTAADDLGAFNWVCDDSTNPVQFVSSGLAHNRGLSDLIDFSSAAFKPNKVTVSLNGVAWGATPSSATWWSNSVANVTSGTLSTQSTIYLVSSEPGFNFSITTDKVALLIQPGLTLTGAIGSPAIAALSQHYLWIEGNIGSSGNTADHGVSLTGTSYTRLQRLSVSGRNDGVHLESASNNTLSDVTASDNGTGIYLYMADNNTLSGVTASNNNTGVYLYYASNNTLTGVAVSNNVYGNGYGVYLFSANYNTLNGVTASNNGSGVNVSYANNNILNGVTASNNSSGVSVSYANNNILRGVTVNNNTFGTYLDNASNNTLSSMTASNNGNSGVYLFTASNNNTFSGVTASNNNTGVYIFNATNSNNTFSDVTASNNNTGVFLNNVLTTFSGALKVGANLTDCEINAVVDDQCATVGASAVVTQGITLADSFVGKVTVDDAANTSDTDGAAVYPVSPAALAAFDWLHADNFYRAWGKDGSANFPNVDQRGQWANGNGRLWDWSLRDTDTVNKAVYSTLPTGDDTLTQTWFDNSTSTYLRNAVEIPADGIGNDNGLCESNETCLFTPNIGSYQGSGNLVSAGSFTDSTTGGLTGITLLQFETNGEANQP
jgi:parallel beta-helix repeat protein